MNGIGFNNSNDHQQQWDKHILVMGLDCHFIHFWCISEQLFQFILNRWFIADSWYYSAMSTFELSSFHLELFSSVFLITQLLNRKFNVLKNFWILFHIYKKSYVCFYFSKLGYRKKTHCAWLIRVEMAVGIGISHQSSIICLFVCLY